MGATEIVTPRWAIYYDDLTRFTSLEGSWQVAPPDGVVFVVTARDEGGAETHGRADYYVMFDDGTVVATGDLGPLLRRRNPPISGADVKFGRWASNTNMARIEARMNREWRPDGLKNLARDE